MKLPEATLLAVFSLALAACGSSPSAALPARSTSASLASKPSQTVSIGLVSPAAAHAPLLVALGKDYFKDANLQVDLQQFASLEAATAALAIDKLDVAATVPSAALFNEVNRGLDTKIVSSLGGFPAQGEPAALAARKDLLDSGQVKTVADLKGRKVALGGGKSGAQAYFTDLMVRPAGLTLNDFEIVSLDFPSAVAALTNKSIDAAYLPEPFKTQAAQQGIAASIAKPPNTGHSGVVTLFGGKFIAQRSGAAKATMVALVRGARDLQGSGGKSDENLAVISKYTKLPVEVLRAGDLHAYEPNLAPDTETVLGMQQLFLSIGQVSYTTPLSADRLIDGSFSQYAATKLGPYPS